MKLMILKDQSVVLFVMKYTANHSVFTYKYTEGFFYRIQYSRFENRKSIALNYIRLGWRATAQFNIY